MVVTNKIPNLVSALYQAVQEREVAVSHHVTTKPLVTIYVYISFYSRLAETKLMPLCMFSPS
jgi:hypothetical protein